MTQLSEISGIDGSESQNCSISGIKKIESDIDSPIINETMTVTEISLNCVISFSSFTSRIIDGNSDEVFVINIELLEVTILA